MFESIPTIRGRLFFLHSFTNSMKVVFSGLISISSYNDETQKLSSSDLIITEAMSLLIKSSTCQDGRYDLIHSEGMKPGFGFEGFKHLGFFGNDPQDTRPKIYVSCLHWGQEKSSAALVKQCVRPEAEVIFFSPHFLSKKNPKKNIMWTIGTIGGL